jgi:hypothetical protein
MAWECVRWCPQQRRVKAWLHGEGQRDHAMAKSPECCGCRVPVGALPGLPWSFAVTMGFDVVVEGSRFGCGRGPLVLWLCEWVMLWGAWLISGSGMFMRM